MILTILSMMIIGLLGVLIGMIIEHGFENSNAQDQQQENEPEIKTVEVIEINDNRQQQENYFKPF